jgi:hypothetical protein
MIRIYNTNTKGLGRIREDSELITLREGEVKLDVIKHDRPNHNPETQRLIKLPPKIDKKKKTYTEGWKVEDLTPYEIAMRDWEAPHLSMRIIAPIQLILDDFGVKMKGWFDLRGLPIIAKGEQVHLYCNEIQPQFQERVDELIDNDLISIETIPQP